MTQEEDERAGKEDAERGAAVLKRALRKVEGAYVPFEVILLLTLVHNTPPLKVDDAIVAAYLMGLENGAPHADPRHG